MFAHHYKEVEKRKTKLRLLQTEPDIRVICELFSPVQGCDWLETNEPVIDICYICPIWQNMINGG